MGWPSLLCNPATVRKKCGRGGAIPSEKNFKSPIDLSPRLFTPLFARDSRCGALPQRAQEFLLPPHRDFRPRRGFLPLFLIYGFVHEFRRRFSRSRDFVTVIVQVRQLAHISERLTPLANLHPFLLAAWPALLPE